MFLCARAWRRPTLWLLFTQSDNSNLMVIEVARRIFHVPHVIARLYNPAARERAYMQLGLDYVCGTFRSLLRKSSRKSCQATEAISIRSATFWRCFAYSIDLSMTPRGRVKVGDLERNHGIRIIAFERRDGSMSSIPTRDSVLYHGDSVLACIRHDLLNSFSVYMMQR